MIKTDMMFKVVYHCILIVFKNIVHRSCFEEHFLSFGSQFELQQIDISSKTCVIDQDL